MKRTLLLMQLFTIVNIAFCQELISLKQYLSELEGSREFLYKESWIDSIYVDPSSSLDELSIIRSAIIKKGLKLYIYEDTFVFIYPNRLEFERNLLLNNKGSRKDQIEELQVGDPEEYDKDTDAVIEGVVTGEFGQTLIGVNIQVNGNLAASTDEQGTYRIVLKPGNYELLYSFVGLESEKKLVTVYSSGSLNTSLFPDSRLLDEIVIEGNSSGQIFEDGSVGVQRIGLEKLEKLPSFLGNVDVIKSATSLPGIAAAGESSSYLNVRGGTNDQTLILMNGTTIYNPGHLLGFYSVFNGDFISDMAVYKGGIPTRFGMRSSSVLDVKMNKWGTKELNVYGGLGLIDSNLGIKRKLMDNKLDINLGGRISYVNWILNYVRDEDVLRSSARFGDVNISSRFIMDEKNSFFLTGFYGKDFFRYSNRIIYKWRTLNGGLRWSRLLTNDWVLESELAVSTLSNTSEGLEQNDEFIFNNGLSETALRGTLSNSQFEFGLDVTNYSIKPGEIAPATETTQVDDRTLDRERLLNIGAHVNRIFKSTGGLEVNAGLRANYFQNLGPGEVNIYREESPLLPANVQNVERVGRGEAISSDFVVEPRVSVNYTLGNNLLRASYSRTNQFLHLISNTVLVNPSSVWKGSDRYIPPTKIDQFSLGYQYTVDERDLSISIDGYYKELDDLIEYRNGATFLMNESLEQEILRAEGVSYGAELLVSKNSGRLSGSASYTYSRTLAKVQDRLQDVSINDGEWYSYYTDRPHNIKFNVDWKISKKWTVSSNFIFLTGAPISAPITVFEVDGISIPYFSERNSERIPDYHRLDLVITGKSRIRRTKKNNDRWVLTLYNLYGRENVANIYFSNQNDAPSQPFQLVNIGRLVPTLTYKFEI